MSVVHTGSTKQFAAGWDAIFSSRQGVRTRSAKSSSPAAPRAAAKKRKGAAKRGKSRGR